MAMCARRALSRLVGRSDVPPRVRRLVGLAVTVAVLVGGDPAHAGSVVRRATLGSSLRLTGTGGAFEYVRLARPLTRPTETKIKATGDAGYVALLLVAEGDLTKDNPTLTLDRLPLAVGGVWTVSFSGSDPRTGQCTCTDDVLPPGLYRAYLLANARTTITAPLPGQVGKLTTLATRVKIRYRLSEIPVAPTPAGYYRPNGEVNDTFTFENPGIVIGTIVMDFSIQHDYTIGSCWYQGTPPPVVEDVAQVCAGGSFFGSGGGPTLPAMTPGRVVGGGIMEAVQPGMWTFGNYWRTTGVVVGVRRFNMWMEYVA